MGPLLHSGDDLASRRQTGTEECERRPGRIGLDSAGPGCVVGAEAGRNGWGETGSRGAVGTPTILPPRLGSPTGSDSPLGVYGSVPAGLTCTQARVWSRGSLGTGTRVTWGRASTALPLVSLYLRGGPGANKGVRCEWILGAEELKKEGAARRAVREGASE